MDARAPESSAGLFVGGEMSNGLIDEKPHYSETHRWSRIHNAWILNESWDDAEEIAMLKEYEEKKDAEIKRLRDIIVKCGKALDTCNYDGGYMDKEQCFDPALVDKAFLLCKPFLEEKP